MPGGLPEVQLGGVAPEIALVATALLMLVLDAFVPEKRDRWYLSVISILGLGASIGLSVGQWGESRLQLGGTVALDGFAVFVKIALAVFGILTVLLARDYFSRSGQEESEFYGLVLFAVAGMMLMAAAADLIVMFLALETFSISLYVLVGFRRLSVVSQESAMKYFLLGSFSSAFFLLGIALAYGATGTTRLYGQTPDDGIAAFLSGSGPDGFGLLLLAVGLLIVGLCFKIAAVPFHMWTPDAYQGAPSPVTGFMAAGTKLAAFAALLRLVDVILFPLRDEWRPLLIAVAIVTMVVGSVLAIVQQDVKRLLAYSSIAHAGFILTGVIAANDLGISGALFYLATYGITVLGAFAVVSLLAGSDERWVSLENYKGLFFEHPLLAAVLALFLLSLAGVPLTSGFVGKLLVFGAAVEAGYWWLAVIGVLASVVATFFYLRVLVVTYMQERTEEAQARPGRGWLAPGVIGLAAAATIFFGLLWGPLIEVAEDATVFFPGA